MELRLQAPGTKHVADGSFGSNMRRTFGWIMEQHAAGRREKNIARFSEFLFGQFDCVGRNVRDKMGNFLNRLPPAHHLTPGRRINAVIGGVANVAASAGFDRTGLVLDGTAPRGGEAWRLIYWWRDQLGDRPTTEAITQVMIMEVQQILLDYGFNAGHSPNGSWDNHSNNSLLACGQLGLALQARNIGHGDPHTL